MSIRGGPDIIEDGLVLHLDAADRNSYPLSGSTIYDLSGNGYNGTFGASTAAPTFSSSNGGVLNFDGSNDEIIISSSVPNPTSGITVSSWIKSDNASKTFAMIATRGASGWNLRFNSNTKRPMFTINIGGIFIDQGEYSTNIVVNDNQWCNVVGVYDGSQVITYVDGVVSGSYTISGSISSNNYSIYVGRREDSTTNYLFDGQIASVSIYNLGLSANEVQQNYNATKGRYGL